ncbi:MULTISPECIES: flagellar basal body rod protein FlgC [Iodidimonas]|jgi:flagellar basal-body rod protein FlgC|uniref:Flagellar basal-body rod protein FlgC n=1 Tax=Iodidimonas nitroreducens TaxID=1236968 RepID=A0A5A7N4W8_9PROT|nr:MULTISPECIES: flagellar basal body rod protein FlgC [Iodidimonas]GAK32327.1 flagellar basal-body rod protein FlgC [alpha proteobacterium Q-1]GER03332.1 flagellar basal-body rod protein FlgC [Iodidimonas nitroreducens]
MDALEAVMKIASHGLQAQSLRLRVVAENIANANSTASVPGGDPFRRKTVVFDQIMDRATGAELVTIKNIGVDRSDFLEVHDPGHPSAGADGMVLMPNVKPLIEMTDMREASRSYQANLNVIEQARSMVMSTVDLLRRA